MAACFAGKRAVSGRGMDVLPADTAYGLQAAFHAAGARGVLGALWQADDKASAEILGCFHERLAAGAPAAVALQQSLRSFLDVPSTLKRRPGRWAWCALTAFAPSTANLKPEGGQP
jgi:CHAT domain-containing protein